MGGTLIYGCKDKYLGDGLLLYSHNKITVLGSHLEPMAYLSINSCPNLYLQDAANTSFA